MLAFYVCQMKSKRRASDIHCHVRYIKIKIYTILLADVPDNNYPYIKRIYVYILNNVKK